MKAWYSIFAHSRNQLSFLLSSRYGDLSAILLKKGYLRVFDQTSWNNTKWMKDSGPIIDEAKTKGRMTFSGQILYPAPIRKKCFMQ